MGLRDERTKNSFLHRIFFFYIGLTGYVTERGGDISWKRLVGKEFHCNPQFTDFFPMADYA